MGKKRSRIDHLKMPFVVTVTMATGACGGTVTDASHGGETATGGSSQGGGAGSGGAGGFIAEAGGYGGVSQGGMATGGFGANPPAPCPSAPPEIGSACGGGPVAPQNCIYDTPVPCGPPTNTYSCVDGIWTASVNYGPTCNPPPVMCPTTPPPPGTSCSGPFGPYSGAPCGYGDCYGVPTEFWSCVQPAPDSGYVWTLSTVSTCNPPPPSWDAGTALPAADGGAADPNR